MTAVREKRILWFVFGAGISLLGGEAEERGREAEEGNERVYVRTGGLRGLSSERKVFSWLGEEEKERKGMDVWALVWTWAAWGSRRSEAGQAQTERLPPLG